MKRNVLFVFNQDHRRSVISPPSSELIRDSLHRMALPFEVYLESASQRRRREPQLRISIVVDMKKTSHHRKENNNPEKVIASMAVAAIGASKREGVTKDASTRKYQCLDE